MTFAVVGSPYTNTTTSNVDTLTVTVGTNATANNLLVALMGVNSGATAFDAVTGWTQFQVHNEGSGIYGGAAYYRIASGTSADDFAVTWTNNGFPSGIVIEFSGGATSTPLTQSAEDASDIGGAVTSKATPSLTPAAGGLLVSIFSGRNNSNWNNPITSASTAGTFTLGYQDDTGTGSYAHTSLSWYEAPDTTARSETFSTSDLGTACYVVSAEFAAAGGGPVATPHGVFGLVFHGPFGGPI